jgi:predicted nucleotidyltransferase
MGMDEETKKLILDVLSSVQYKRIILFGSRARGEATRWSDCDLLIVLNEDMSIPEKMILASSLRVKFAEKGIDADIILKSDKEVDYYRDKIGSVTREALKEGVVL